MSFQDIKLTIAYQGDEPVSVQHLSTQITIRYEKHRELVTPSPSEDLLAYVYHFPETSSIRIK